MTEAQIEQRLRQAFPEAQIAVMDLTGTQDHWEVRISSPELKSLSRVKSHQEVMNVFSEELKTGEVHALAIKVI